MPYIHTNVEGVMLKSVYACVVPDTQLFNEAICYKYCKVRVRECLQRNGIKAEKMWNK